MGAFNKLKLWYNCKKSGRMQEYYTYKLHLKQKISHINSYSKFLSDAVKKFVKIKKKFSEESKEYVDAKNEMYRWQHTLDEAKLSLKYIRPNSRKDVDYRNQQCETFANKLQSVLSHNFDLRFHGTPIYFAEQIIKNRMISSTADRYDGYIKSTDMRGEISVSDRESIGRTINFFSDMTAYQRSLPSGCIFALLPKDKNDAKYGTNLMRAIDFTKNPEQLFGVFTTPENIKSVKEWMNEAQFNPDLVYTFEEFLQEVKVKSDKIDRQAKFSYRIDENYKYKPQINGLENISQIHQEIGEDDNKGLR